MERTLLLVGLLLLTSCCVYGRDIKSSEKPVSTRDKPYVGSRGLHSDYLVQNIAVQPGSSVSHSCRYDPLSLTDGRIQWTEYAYSESGQLISEGGFILGHPQAARYLINVTEEDQYDLLISNVMMADGGVYQSADVNAAGAEIGRVSAELIVIEPMNCTTNIPDTGLVIEDNYYSIECTVKFQSQDIAPWGSFSGPAPFSQGQTITDQSVLWSGMSFNAHRTMRNQWYQSLIYFDGRFLPPPSGSAANIPDYTELFQGNTLDVVWRPKNMYADPIKDAYAVNDVITCYADASPPPIYSWFNSLTLERVEQQDIAIAAHWVGLSFQLRCTAYNRISGTNYTQDYNVAVNVPVVTTPPTTPPTTPSTTPPAVSDCFETTGAWSSISPTKAALCILVDTNNQGSCTGGFRNDTDTFWVDLIGNAEMGRWEHISWAAIWPGNTVVSSFIAECYQCDGEEIMLVSAISRTKGTGICGSPGTIYYSQEYVFKRDLSLKCSQFLPPGK